jgi:carbamoyl-phosphate synthase large subunit
VSCSMSEVKNPIRVLVTGVGGGSIGEQVCKSLRLGRHPYQIIATNTTLDATRVIRADAVEVLPVASSSDYLEKLLGLIKRYEIQFLIPGSEPELIRLSKNTDAFASSNVKLLINAPQVISKCVNKQLTFDFLTSHGFHMPRTIMLEKTQDEIAPPMSFPCIIKPAQGGGGSVATFLAQDEEELRFFIGYLIKYGYRPLIQEYIPDAENEYTVGVLHSPQGNLLGTAVLRRQILSGLSNRLRIANQTGRTEMGKILAVSSGISQGEIVDFEPVRLVSERIAQAIGSVGPLNIQGRWDGSRFVPFEINPRFSGTTPMRALAGFNEPERMIEAWLGIKQDEKTASASPGFCIRGLTEHFIPLDGGEVKSSV